MLKPRCLACLLVVLAACRAIPEGPEIQIEYQDIVVHAATDVGKLLISCRLRATQLEASSESRLVFALAPDHPVSVTQVRDGQGRRVGEGAVRVLSGTDTTGSYTVIPVALRESLPPHEPIDLEFEYTIALDPLPGGELLATERDVITPIGHPDLRRRLSGGAPSSTFRYQLVAHPADPPPQTRTRFLWIGIAPGERQEADDPPLQESFHVRSPRPAVALCYGPYRPIRTDSSVPGEVAALPEISTPRANRLLALAAALDASLATLLHEKPPDDPLRIVPGPIERPATAGRLIVLPRTPLASAATDSPELCELVATGVARSHLSMQGLDLDVPDPGAAEGLARYLALAALEMDHGDQARAIKRLWQESLAARARDGTDRPLDDAQSGSGEERRLAGEKAALALRLLDRELAPDQVTRPVLGAITKLGAGAPPSFARFLESLEPAPSGKLAEHLRHDTAPLAVRYSFTIADAGNGRYRTSIALRASEDVPFAIPLRLWSPWSEAPARGRAGEGAPPLAVETPFLPVAVLADAMPWPLDLHTAASGARSDPDETHALVAELIKSHGGDQLAACATIALHGQGVVRDADDRRADAAALDFVRGGRLLVHGATQTGEAGGVIAEGPEIYLSTLGAIASGELSATILAKVATASSWSWIAATSWRPCWRSSAPPTV